MHAFDAPPPGTPRLAVSGTVGRDDTPRLSEQLSALLRDSPAATVVCDVGEISHPNAATIEVLARLQLTARRLGGGIRLHNANQRLCELLVLTGLDAVLPAHRATPID